MQAQSFPAFPLELAILQAAAVQVPEGVVPFHVIVPENPSLQAQSVPAFVLELAMVHFTAVHVGAFDGFGQAASAVPATHFIDASPLYSKPSLHEKVATLPCLFSAVKDTLPLLGASALLPVHFNGVSHNWPAFGTSLVCICVGGGWI